MTKVQYGLLWILSSLRTFTSAALVNVTVDDNAGDPVSLFKISYTSSWNYGPDCSGCQAKLDAKQVYMGSWHDATHKSSGIRQNATFDFIGEHKDVMDIACC